MHRLPLLAENDFLPDLDSIPADIRRRAKLLVLNYPNSPTGKTATREFYARVIDFARANKIVVVQDAAHIMFSYDGPPLSFLQVPGAREVGVEVHSLSKGWNMIGWRMGWVCGHPLLVRAFADVKDNCDSGQFIAIQKAAAAALDDPEIPAPHMREVSPAAGKAGGHARPLRVRLPDAGRIVFPLHPQPQGDRRRPAVPHGRGLQPISSSPSIRFARCPGTTPARICGFSVTYEAPDEAAEDALMAETAAAAEADRAGVLTVGRVVTRQSVRQSVTLQGHRP